MRLAKALHVSLELLVLDEIERGPSDYLLFGMWQDRDDLGDVEAHVRELRAPRYNLDGS